MVQTLILIAIVLGFVAAVGWAAASRRISRLAPEQPRRDRRHAARAPGARGPRR
jgi:hypothetical protein